VDKPWKQNGKGVDQMFAQWSNILNFLIYLGVTLPLLAMGIAVFLITTPYREFQLIRDGADTTDPQKMAAAKAAAHDLGGKIIGLTIVLASAVFHSLHVWDLVLWGVIGILFQVLVFYLFELLTPFKVVSEIPKGNVSVAIFASRLSVASGLLMAALISY
jgi:putative membrane protein